MRKLVRLLSPLLLPAAFLVVPPTASAAPLPGGPARTAGLDADWVCAPNGVVTGDGSRRMQVCVNNWSAEPSSPGGTRKQWRGVVQLRTQKLYGNQWYDSVSQSVTVNMAIFYPVDHSEAGATKFGNNYGSDTCRVNGAGSSRIACSVLNTSLVTYYGRAWNSSALDPVTCTFIVTWRDDAGRAHTGDGSNGGLVCDHD